MTEDYCYFEIIGTIPLPLELLEALGLFQYSTKLFENISSFSIYSLKKGHR